MQKKNKIKKLEITLLEIMELYLYHLSIWREPSHENTEMNHSGNQFEK